MVSVDALPFISIIVPVRNEARFISTTLERIFVQDYPRSRFEVILIDGQSEDATVDLAWQAAIRHPDVSFFCYSNERRLSSAARNIGVARSKGEYILIIDGHVDIPGTDLLKNAARVIQETGAHVIGRPQRLSATGLSDTQQLIAAVRGSRIGHAQDSHIYSENGGWVSPASVAVMYHRDLFKHYGLFDESFDAAEDLEFNTRLERAGWRCYTSPSLEVFYYPRESLKGLFRQMRRYGLGRARLWLKLRTFPSVSSLAPLALTTGLPGSVLLGLLGPGWLGVSFLGLVSYASLFTAVYLTDPAVRRFPWIRGFAVIATTHIGLGVGCLNGLLSGLKHRLFG